VAQRDLRRIERAVRDVDQARDELRSAILHAREAGETYEDIGNAAGVSRQRIAQIVQEED
jgi:hypothetical protein